MKTINNSFLILEETQSTNIYLKELASEQLLPDFFSVRTNYQTAGRGQRGNHWESTPNDNLLCSVVLHPTFVSANRSFYISQIVSLSLIKSLEKFSDECSIKWPNDIYWRNKKIAGILIENQFLSNQVNQSIIGVGLNLNQASFSPKLINPVSLYHITGTKNDIDELWKDFINHLKGFHQLLKEGKAGQIKIEYHNKLYRNKGFHLYQDAKGLFEAYLYKVQPDGQLILIDKDNQQRKYYFKEVSYIIE